jgi:hypothetical protein
MSRIAHITAFAVGLYTRFSTPLIAAYQARRELVKAETDKVVAIQNAGQGYVTCPQRGFSPLELDLIRSDDVPPHWRRHAARLKAEYAALQASLAA